MKGDSFKSFEMVGLNDTRLEQVRPGGAIVALCGRTGPVYVHRLRALRPSLRAQLIRELPAYEETEETSAS